ncbi:MAG: hypothetical protein K2K57_00470 [Oscillospiraceae bacterium]|nr:hypothetical protein [Oscillospiraceae bacterium]
MKEYTHLIIDDGRPLSTEEDWRASAAEIGVPYEDYLAALDHGIFNADKTREFSRNLHKEQNA